MCGIAGALNIEASGPIVERMLESLAHRGPDDSGVATLRRGSAQVVGTLGHKRLAILDLSANGCQPMATPCGRLTVVLNGEIYNFRDLRPQLADAGYVFQSDSDTEVILAGWLVYGPAFVHKLHGMFAFAMWDADQQRGWLVRDVFGIKPLYVWQSDGQILFASELRALLASGLCSRDLSSTSVRSYLATGSVSEPATAIAGIQMLPPGSVTEINLRGEPILRDLGEYHEKVPDSCAAEREIDPKAAGAAVRAALSLSVRRHLVSDVPIGCFLSGGIDSSALVGLAAEAGAGSIETFTVCFAEAEYDESQIARAVARRYGTRHSEIRLDESDLLRALPGAFAAMDQPTIDGLNTYVVSRAVRERGIRVVLSGLGGDEIFGGYPSFRRTARLSRLWQMPSGVRRHLALLAGLSGGVRAEKMEIFLSAASPPAGAYQSARALFGPKQIATLTGVPSVAAIPRIDDVPLLEQVSRYEMAGYMLNTLLRDSDVFSMAHGLELRVPFVDRSVVDAAFRIDDSLKLSSGVSKPVLLAAVRDLLPPEVYARKKQGFVLPIAKWMHGALRAEVERAFSDDRLLRVGLEPHAARAVWTEFLRGRIGWARPWALYTLLRWADTNGICLAPGAASSRGSVVVRANS